MGCLVNHSYKNGLFTLQIPISPSVQDIQKLSNNRDKIIDMILSCFSDDLTIGKGCIDIKHVGSWKLSALMANKFYNFDKRII